MKTPPWFREQVRLGPLTTFEVGGVARYLAMASDAEQLDEALRFAAGCELPVCVLGGGSNVVIADDGFGGVVVQPHINTITWHDDGKVQVGAGCLWDDVVAHSVQRDLAGLECLSGIPGWAGAAPIQNIGAYGQEIAETVTEVMVMDRHSQQVQTLSGEDCGFGYRDSRFKRDWSGRYVVIQVNLQLQRHGMSRLSYPQLQQHLQCDQAQVGQVRAAVLTLRRAKSMVIEPQDPNRRCAGSFFVNPIVSQATWAMWCKQEKTDLPHFDSAGGVKVPAAWLIERAGFAKGTSQGEVGLSTKHALAIINRGEASAQQLVMFARRIQTVVFERFGVKLAPEPRFVGFLPNTDDGSVVLEKYVR